MRKTLYGLSVVVAAALSFAAVSRGETGAGGYQIKDADRGMVHRVKVLYDGRKIATIVLSRGRTQASSYCCTPDGCKEIATEASCSTFKMTCDKDGACWASGPRVRSSASALNAA